MLAQRKGDSVYVPTPTPCVSIGTGVSTGRNDLRTPVVSLDLVLLADLLLDRRVLTSRGGGVPSHPEVCITDNDTNNNVTGVEDRPNRGKRMWDLSAGGLRPSSILCRERDRYPHRDTRPPPASSLPQSSPSPFVPLSPFVPSRSLVAGYDSSVGRGGVRWRRRSGEGRGPRLVGPPRVPEGHQAALAPGCRTLYRGGRPGTRATAQPGSLGPPPYPSWVCEIPGGVSQRVFYKPPWVWDQSIKPSTGNL